MTVQIINADVIDGLFAIAPGSVHTCVTSPPYWGLRDYGVSGQIGLEPDPYQYVERIVEVFRHVRRVLRDDGTLWVNMGDTYTAGCGGDTGKSGLDGSTRSQDESKKAGQRVGSGSSFRRDRRRRQDLPHKTAPALRTKNLVGVPWRVAFALQADGWYLRSDIIWHKPNPMPESVTDRPTKSHEYIFLLAKSKRYYYDADAIKETVTGNAHDRGSGVNPKARVPSGWDTGKGDHRGKAGRYPRQKQNESFSKAVTELVKRRNKRTVWTIPTQAYPDAHFATFPENLIRPCILAGCPAGGTVLDPFAGSGTTGKVAEEEGRDSVLIEINPEYCDLIRKRTS